MSRSADNDAIARLEAVSPGPGEANARPQDVGRRHRRKGAPSPETAALLGRYRAAMRAELEATLRELALDTKPPAAGVAQVLLDGSTEGPKRPALETRVRLWDLGIKLGRELGAEIDPGPSPTSATTEPAKPRRRGRVDYGGR